MIDEPKNTKNKQEAKHFLAAVTRNRLLPRRKTLSLIETSTEKLAAEESFQLTAAASAASDSPTQRRRTVDSPTGTRRTTTMTPSGLVASERMFGKLSLHEMSQAVSVSKADSRDGLCELCHSGGGGGGVPLSPDSGYGEQQLCTHLPQGFHRSRSIVNPQISELNEELKRTLFHSRSLPLFCEESLPANRKPSYTTSLSTEEARRRLKSWRKTTIYRKKSELV